MNAGRLATIIELGTTARRPATLSLIEKGDHRNVTYPFALDGLFRSEGWAQRMLTVRDFELIRRKSLVDKQSIRSIAKGLRRFCRSAPRA
jgi:hypothetical protein